MAQPVYDWVRDLPGMFVAGLHRVAGWLMSFYGSVRDRLSFLSRRYPSVPANVINQAYVWVQTAAAAGTAAMQGGIVTYPSIVAYPGVPLLGQYHYDLVHPYLRTSDGTIGRVRYDIVSSSALSTSDIRAQATAALRNEINRILAESPRPGEPSPVHPLDPIVMAAYFA